MLYQIIDGTVTLGGTPILSHVDFEIKGDEKLAVVGANGAGKTTLLRLIAGEITTDRDDRQKGPSVVTSRRLTVGMLRQQAFDRTEEKRTVEELLLEGCPDKDYFSKERFFYEKEYDRIFTGFGFVKQDKKRAVSHFSGGEQTKIGLIRLLLERPDILILDEPTNHLDIKTMEWLERYLKEYDKAVVMVSHDRFFLDRTANVVYELYRGKLTRYPGNYSDFRRQKLKDIHIRTRAYERQQEELLRLNGLVERFKHKPNKAAFARSKRKAAERIERISRPEEDDVHLFAGELTPAIAGSKWVFEAEHLKLGYEKQLLELSLRIRRGQKIAVMGDNGVGKTTFLKTVAGLVSPLGGDYSMGNNITIGYFDQKSGAIQSERTVAEHFRELFPALPEKELRSTLGAYLFGGREAEKKVNSLSGGEKARLSLAELLQSRPNFLVLDEPTNHMDIRAKETLESAFSAYTGTILFVSHDRYFVRQVADAILIFEGQAAMYYPFGYDHYLAHCEDRTLGNGLAAKIRAEDQALVAGLKAVPRAERHRLREIPVEEAYREWKLKLALEQLEAAGERYMTQAVTVCSVWQDWMGGIQPLERLENERERCRLLEDEWTGDCLRWYDEYLESRYALVLRG